MLDTTSSFKNAVDSDHSLKPKVRLLAEWSHNRYGPDVKIDSNTKSIDPDQFPLESVISPLRPKSGMPFWIGRGRPTRDDADVRWRVSGHADAYKYWASPVMGNTNVYVRFNVTYGSLLPTNKINVTFETGGSDVLVGWPTVVDIYTTTDGSSWTNVHSSGLHDIKQGTMELWYNGTGWQQTETLDDEIQLYGVMAIVRNIAYRRSVQLIELGMGLKKDVTDRVKTINVTKTREEMDAVLPVGTMEANSCEITLANEDRLFDPTNSSSKYYDIIDENVVFYPYFGYEIDGASEFVPGGVYYADRWQESSDNATVEVTSTDFSKFLQEDDIPTTFFVNKRAAVVMSEILAKAGVNDTKWNISNYDDEYAIPYIWFKDKETVWEALRSIAKAVQAVFYFDEEGVFNFDSKSYIFDPERPVVHELREEPDGLGGISNIHSFSNEFDVSANKVDIRYEPLAPNYERHNIPIYSILWEPKDDIALQAAPIQQDVSKAHTSINVGTDAASLMPYEGYVELNGEIIKYRGKSYRYYPGSDRTNHKTVILYSHDDKENIDQKSNEFNKQLNHFTGVLRNLERGQFGTRNQSHRRDTMHPKWISRRFTSAGDLFVSNNDRIRDARLHMWLPSWSSYNTWNVMYRGVSSTVMHHYGTKLRFAESFKNVHGIAGLATHLYSAGGIFRGYYFELVMSDFANNTALGNIGSIRAYRMDRDGARKGLPNTEEGIRGYDMPVVAGRDYEIEVSYSPGSKNWRFYVDGEQITAFKDPYAFSYKSGRFGMYVRGRTSAYFDYFYATNANTIPQKVAMTNWAAL